MLFRVAITDDGLFDQSWWVLMNLERGPLGNQQCYASNLTQLHTDFYVRCQERIFKRTRIGPVSFHNLFKPFAHTKQTRGKSKCGGCPNRSEVDQLITTTVAVNDSPTGCLTSWINSYTAHKLRGTIHEVGL